MARYPIVVAMACAMFAVFVCLQLLLNFFPPVVPALVTQHNVDADAGSFLVGAGRGDITGPVVEIDFMGYASLSQIGTGLRQRLYSRAFIIGNPSTPAERVLYLIMDTQSGDTAVRDGILKGLASMGDEYSVYTKDNVAVVGTHSHSGPGAWLNYLLPQVTTLGFDPESYTAIVDGSLLAIQRAHESLTPGSVSVGVTELTDASANRSPYAYQANPAAEQAKYQYDTDKNMTLLKFTRASDGKAIGILNWFAVHGTSLYENNTLATGDNKGLAAYLFEQFALTDGEAAPGFVAGFSQANVGDTTPNILGAYCADTGLPCRFNDSTCGGKTEGCQGRGPLFQVPDNGTQSCYEIGRRQFNAAKSIYQSTTLSPITGTTVTGFHTFQDFSNYTFISPLNASRGELTTCSAALGYSFAGGTSDGPGAFDFTQGINNSDPNSPALKNPLWAAVRDLLHDPSPQQRACQSPKPILFDAGATLVPYQWAPNIIDVQVLRAGSLVMIISPGEATTMSGRRWRDAISAAAQSKLSITSPTVILGAPANTYSHYIATEEEYSVQRYEGASTLHGPHTLEAHINLTLTYLPLLASSSLAKGIAAGPNPPINTNNSLNFNTPVIVDTAPLLKKFGQATSNPSTTTTYTAGSSPRPTTSFIGADPRNSLRLEQTYAELQIQDGSTWRAVRNDTDWYLVFRWYRDSTILGTSHVDITWEIDQEDPTNVQSGTYRMAYYGNSKSLTGTITAFSGTGGTFKVSGTG